MTKKEMIQTMQQQEASLFLEAKKYEYVYGREDGITQAALGRWLGVNAVNGNLRHCFGHDVARDNRVSRVYLPYKQTRQGSSRE
jgi:hypothetical protein